MKIKTDHYLTQTERKYIKLAYDYCIKNNMQACFINSKTIQFNFTDKQGVIMAGNVVKCMDGQYRSEIFKRFSLEENNDNSIIS